MNPGLLHPSFDYPLASDHDYLSHDRGFQSGRGLLPSHDFVQPFRKAAATSENPAHAPAVAVNSDSEYGPHTSFHEPSFHTSSGPLLSPPDSLSGSVSASRVPISSLSHATLPKLVPNYACTADHYTTTPAPGPFLHLAWGDQNMTDFNRSRVPTLQPAGYSPPMTFGTAAGMSGPYLGASRLPDPYSAHYHPSRSPLTQAPANFNDLSKYVTMGPSRGLESLSHTTLSHGTAHHHSTSFAPHPGSPPGGPDGPPFGPTKLIHPITTSQNQKVSLEIVANIQKGFFQVDQKWTCYRRNYFTVTCGLNMMTAVANQNFYLPRSSHGGRADLIEDFGISISAKTARANNQDSEPRSLVQHTPKRDKATESTPKRQIIVPSAVGSLSPSSTLSMVSRGYAGSQHMSTHSGGSFDSFGSGQQPGHPTSYTFERIQFQKATANNGKRRAQQQYFHVIVELWAKLASSHGDPWVLIATRQSEPMVVRGRSPGHYKDGGRRDSSASMDPDGGPGGGDEGGRHGGVPSLIGGQTHSSMTDWPPSHRRSANSGGYAYRDGSGLQCSPDSVSPPTGFAASPQGGPHDHFDPSQMTRSQPNPAHEGVRGFAPRHLRAEVGAHSRHSTSTYKRPYEEDLFGPGSLFSESSLDGGRVSAARSRPFAVIAA